MAYAPGQQNQSGQMIGAGMGKALQRGVKTAGYQIQNPDEDLMTSVLKAYGWVPGKPGISMPTGVPMPDGLTGIPNAGVSGAADAGAAAAGGGGLMAGLKSL